MGEVVSRRTSGRRAARLNIPPRMGWRGRDISMIISSVKEPKLDDPMGKPSRWEVSTAKKIKPIESRRHIMPQLALLSLGFI